MRPVGVVFVPESVDGRLDGVQVRPDGHLVEEFPAQGLVEPFHLPGRGWGGGLGEPVDDAVLPADPVEHHLTTLAEPVSELLAVVRQDFLGHPEPLQPVGEGQAHRAAGGPADDLGDDAEPGMVVDPGDDLGFGAIGEHDPADDVHLPQLHRPSPLPPHIVPAAPATLGRFDQTVADQDPIHRHPRRHRIRASMPAQLERDPPGTPPRMKPTQLTHQRLHLRRCLMSTPLRSAGSVFQPGESPFGIAGEPGMDGLPGHPDPGCHLDHGFSRLNRQHRPIPLFHDRQLHQRQSRPPQPAMPATITR